MPHTDNICSGPKQSQFHQGHTISAVLAVSAVRRLRQQLPSVHFLFPQRTVPETSFLLRPVVATCNMDSLVLTRNNRYDSALASCCCVVFSFNAFLGLLRTIAMISTSNIVPIINGK